MAGRYSVADYTSALRRLMPRGRVWPSDAVTEQAQVIGTLAPTFARIDEDAVNLIVDAFPATTMAFVEEWEAALGLPDPCLGPNPTLQQRRDQIVARFVNSGGQSATSFIAFAASLGFVITIPDYAPFGAGRARPGQPVGGGAWALAWLVTIVSDATSADHAAFRAGVSRAGDPLASTAAGHDALFCEIRARAPAHTVPLFTF